MKTQTPLAALALTSAFAMSAYAAEIEFSSDLDIMLAQRIYNNSIWPNPVVVKLTAVQPVQP